MIVKLFLDNCMTKNHHFIKNKKNLSEKIFETDQKEKNIT